MISLYQSIVCIYITCIYMPTWYIYMDASICLTRNHQELPELSKSCSMGPLRFRVTKGRCSLSAVLQGRLLAIQDPRLVTVDFRFLQQGQQLEFVSILQLDQGKHHFKFMRNKLLFFTFCTR